MELYKNFEKQEDDGSMLRLMFTKLKSEVKMIVQKCSQLDVKLLEANKKFESSEKDLTYSRFVIQQVKILNEILAWNQIRLPLLFSLRQKWNHCLNL